MMPFELLIDGYNLLHAAGWGKIPSGRGNLQRRRARLLSHLGERLDVEVQKRTVIVFDARHSPPGDSVDEPGSERRLIEVQFAPRTQEADDVIEELLAKHSVPKSVLVVSSDHRIQKAARRRGAEAVDSDVFLDQIADDEAHVAPKRHSKSPPLQKSPEETPDEMLAEAEAELRKALKEDDSSPPEELDSPAPTKPTLSADPLDDAKFWEERIQEGAAARKKPRQK
jgi:predicted RNA-binding protein with PIN domain